MFIRQMLVFALTAVIAFPIFADEKRDAMFGLSWGMTVDAIKAMGVSVSKKEGDKNIDTYVTTSLPKNLSDIEQYSLLFSDGKLVKLSAIGKDITDDPTGRNGKDRFDVLKKSLEDKYGVVSKSYQTVGNKLYKEYDEFYQCLSYSGCGMWVAIFDTPTKAVVIELKGLRRGTGFINLTVEATPEWDEALAKFKSFKSKNDSDAL